MFDGLLPEPHNTTILKLIFTCDQWHALAKLRMHTDRTLDIMDSVTIRLGREFRAFSKNTCPAFKTKELKREAAARKKRQFKKSLRAAGSQRDPPSAESCPTQIHDGQLQKTFNLRTVKYHFLGDHVDLIREFGTNDSHSTEPVRWHHFSTVVVFSFTIQGELEHRTPKARYPRTSRKFFVGQLTNIDRRETRLRRIRGRLSRSLETQQDPTSRAAEEHHHIGTSEASYEHIGTFLRSGAGDPALKVKTFLFPHEIIVLTWFEGLRTFYLSLKNTSSRALSMRTSLTKVPPRSFSKMIASTSTAFAASTTRHMMCVVIKTPSIHPHRTATSWF